MITDLESVIEAVASHPDCHHLNFWATDHHQISYRIWKQRFVEDIRKVLSGAEPETPIEVQLYARPEEEVKPIVDSQDIDLV
jgi:hypothetical protein